MGNKRFFWLRLPINFRQRTEIKRLYKKHPESADTIAMTYIDILSHVANTDGVFTVGEGADSLTEELAMMIDRNEEDVDATCEYLQTVGAMVVLEENRKADFPYLREIVGSETDSAGRMRAKRERDKEASQSDGDSSQSDTEKERDIEGDIESEEDEESETETKKQIETDRESEHTTHTDNNACVRVRGGNALNAASCLGDSMQDDGFENFWEAYPRKIGKAAARSAWVKLNPGYEMQVRLINAVGHQKKSEQWNRDNGRFIPSPEKWLQEQRWDDEPDAEVNVYTQMQGWVERLDEWEAARKSAAEVKGFAVSEEDSGGQDGKSDRRKSEPEDAGGKDAPTSPVGNDSGSRDADAPEAEPCKSPVIAMYANITRDRTDIPECLGDALRGWFLEKEKRGQLPDELKMQETIDTAIRYATLWNPGGDKYIAGFIRECTSNGEDALDFRRTM